MDSNNNFDFNASMSLSEGVSDEEVSTEETENSRFTGILHGELGFCFSYDIFFVRKL